MCGPSLMEENQQRHRYSFVYNELVEDSNDFVGLVAYSIYKQDKIAYVRCFEGEHGRVPDPHELKDFHTQAKIHIERYKEIAENRVSNFYDTIFKVQSEELEEKYRQQLTQELKAMKPSWWFGVFQGVVGSVLYTLLLGTIILTFLYAQYGLGWVVNQCIKITTLSN